MKLRRKNGAVLSLIVVCILVIIVIGIGCFLLAKLLGGGREAANATDSGTLNVAKNAIVTPSVPATDDFLLIGQGNNGKISLLNYNRAVAQTLLVALNAQDEDTSQALTNAKSLLAKLNTLGDALTAGLNNDAQMAIYFSAASFANNTRMLGGSSDNFVSSQYKTADMKVGQSTNVYFDMASFPTSGPAPAGLEVKGNSVVPGIKGLGNYMAGYQGFSVPGVGTVYGVPVMPAQNPHLVSLSDFNSSNATFPNTPPNSFKVGSSTKESKSNMFIQAVACSLVGCSQAKPGATEFDGSIPGGYIIIANAAGTSLPSGFQPGDNSNNIFNNELYYQPGLLSANSGSSQIFAAVNPNTMDSSAVSNMQAWVSWAQAGGTGTPPSSTAGMNIATQPGQPGTPLSNPPTQAQLQILKGLNGATNCLDQLNGQGTLSGNCQTWLSSYTSTYSPAPSNNGSTMPQGNVYSAVDLAKADTLTAFQNSQQTASLPPTMPVTGLGVYPPGANGQNGPPGSYGLSWPQVNGPMQQAGSVMALLKQVNSQPGSTCQFDSVMAQLLQRCKEIKPGYTQAELNTLLGTTLPMGATLYIYRSQNGLGDLIISQTQPPTKSTQIADSNPNATMAQCSDSYNVMGTLVDTSGLTTGTGQGDGNLHGQPFMTNSGGLVATDVAAFVLSSGYGNLLGELKFSNSVTTSNNFTSGTTGSGTSTTPVYHMKTRLYSTTDPNSGAYNPGAVAPATSSDGSSYIRPN
jgi:hypothetical protein